MLLFAKVVQNLPYCDDAISNDFSEVKWGSWSAYYGKVSHVMPSCGGPSFLDL
jgi:hypothetical protein